MKIGDSAKLSLVRRPPNNGTALFSLEKLKLNKCKCEI